MSWTNAAVTEAGLALQAKLVDGQTLGFLRVAAGTGTVDPSVLANQTALANEKQTLTFQPPNVLDGAKIKVPVMLNNIGLEAGYTMQQLGFFAEDPDNGEILYAIVQDEVGDTVPSQTESPGFVIEWAFVFEYGNAGSVTVTLDPVGLVSIGMVGQLNGVAGLGENGAVPVTQGGTGATTTQAALAVLGAGVRPNLGINCDFSNPVNQRGQSTYTTVSGPSNIYTLDMWKTASSGLTVNVKNGYVELVGTVDIWFLQILDPECIDVVGKTVTVSVLHVDGRLDAITKIVTNQLPLSNNGAAAIGYLDGHYVFGVHGGLETLQIQAIKIEIGDSQTIAYQDADGAWHQLPQQDSDYATQLAKCQAYLQVIKYMRLRVAALNSGSLLFTIPTPVSMRAAPVLLNAEEGVTCTVESDFSYSGAQTGFTLSAGPISTNSVSISAIKSGHGLTDAGIILQNLMLSAEL